MRQGQRASFLTGNKHGHWTGEAHYGEMQRLRLDSRGTPGSIERTGYRAPARQKFRQRTGGAVQGAYSSAEPLLTAMSGALKLANTMSGALKLWREGKRRPIQTFVALPFVKAMIGASNQLFSSGRSKAMRATSALNSVTYMERRAAKGLPAIARSKPTSSTI